MSKRFKLSAGNLLAASAAVVLCLPISARADDNESGRSRQYEVRVTNITRGQQFTPLLTVVHNSRVTLFTLGSPASSALAQIIKLRTCRRGSLIASPQSYAALANSACIVFS